MSEQDKVWGFVWDLKPDTDLYLVMMRYLKWVRKHEVREGNISLTQHQNKSAPSSLLLSYFSADAVSNKTTRTVKKDKKQKS